MASKTAILSVRVVSDVKNAQKGLKTVERQTMTTAEALDKATLPAAAAMAALGALGKAAVDSASELQQSAGAVESVFAKQAGVIKSAANNAVESVGLSKSAYQNLATVLGAQLKNMGVPMQEVAGKTKTLITLGADLAATFGGTTSDAVAAVSALLRGERDPIERYGVSIKQSDINARMAAQGLNNLTGEALKNAETQTVLAMLTEQTAAAHGQFAREADTLAGAQQRATAQWEDAKAELGNALLPVMTKAASALKIVAKFTKEHSTATLVLAGGIGGLATAVLVVNGAVKAYAALQTTVTVATALWTGAQTLLTGATKSLVVVQKTAKAATVVWTAAQWALNVALDANPVGLVIVAIGALVAGIVVAYNKSETFRNIVNRLWGALRSGAGYAARAVRPIADAFYSIVGGVRAAWDWTVAFFNSIRPPYWLRYIGRFIGLTVGDNAAVFAAAGVEGMAARAPSLPRTVYKTAGADSTPFGGGQTINITVNGALDPVAVANQIQKLLNMHQTRQRGGLSYG